jgi:hypothetical protein
MLGDHGLDPREEEAAAVVHVVGPAGDDDHDVVPRAEPEENQVLDRFATAAVDVGEEQGADLIRPDHLDEFLIGGSIRDGLPAQAEVVEELDPSLRPPKRASIGGLIVLDGGAAGVLLDLTRRRLSQVDSGDPGKMMCLHL